MSYVDRYDNKSPKDQGDPWHVPLKDPSRVGDAAVFAWSYLKLDRSRKLVGLSRPPSASRLRMATPVLTWRTATSSTPSPRASGAVFTPVRGG